ncbi:UDP-4-amino-4,6-dideoxy-N-acetyl-beta-L-altrosamine N-acetyltransferase [Halopseudomonas salegens]|uniref:UDP-4-amino-4,6-dideoxy-N-acetyl-beta-L-altrosamine N-acetyltransferase n=1 Tax=Halopseudomonas salegens TaxID=1434072 RepID=A0A1H2EJV1_9GAMM|nr:UDP-4-amino-4,6-dideoxy-N-acetyl-beta-L-altrosamine N-acetyltransferase [Halopseudomonas salegens]SDT95377.1 UDP-4-amino-4,6-dideoxy-N-acetyl-beta-L-altrosamine N-acetyltransferase [Halopseudomonas salegens]
MAQAPQQLIRPMQASDLETVLAWRNHPDVRDFMYTKHEITLAEHTAWFAKASRDAQRHLMIFESNEVPVGFSNLHQIAEGGIADWGFYTAPEAVKGTGRALGKAALEYAFVELGLHKVCGQALAFNQRSIRFHDNLGFQQEGVLRQQHFDGQRYHDVVCFGLLASEWQTNN